MVILHYKRDGSAYGCCINVRKLNNLTYIDNSRRLRWINGWEINPTLLLLSIQLYYSFFSSYALISTSCFSSCTSFLLLQQLLFLLLALLFLLLLQILSPNNVLSASLTHVQLFFLQLLLFTSSQALLHYLLLLLPYLPPSNLPAASLPASFPIPWALLHPSTFTD